MYNGAILCVIIPDSFKATYQYISTYSILESEDLSMGTDGIVKGFTTGVLDSKYADKLISMPKKLRDCFKVKFGMAFDGYLKNAFGKYSEAKTLLYTDRPRKIRDFLVTPVLKHKDGDYIAVNTMSDIIGQDQFILI